MCDCYFNTLGDHQSFEAGLINKASSRLPKNSGEDATSKQQQ